MKFKPWLRHIIKTLQSDGVLNTNGVSEMIISRYEDIEELFEHGLGSQLVAQLLTEDLYDQENEDGTIEDDDENNPDDNWDEDGYDPEKEDDDIEFPEEENLNNQTSEPDDENDEYSDWGKPKITQIFDTRIASANILRFGHKILLFRIFSGVFLL